MKNNLIPGVLLLVILWGCHKTALKSDLTLENEIYLEKGTSKPFSGTMVAYYDSGELEIEVELEEGRVKGYQNYGYEGELLEKCIYHEIKGLPSKQEEVQRVNLIDVQDDLKRWKEIQIILKEGYSKMIDFEKLTEETLKNIKAHTKLLDDFGTEFYSAVVTFHELQPPVFEYRFENHVPVNVLD